MRLCRSYLISLALPLLASAYDNGLARTPPMGWKPWNAFQGNINDTVIRMAIDAAASRARSVDGVPTSLLDLGYVHIGIDDNWQACKTGWKGSFHAEDGSPLLNKSKFPDLKALVSYGNNKGAKMGWYTINCICLDSYIVQGDANWTKRVYEKEAQLILDSGFYGVKIDNCGDDRGIGFEQLVQNLNASGKPILIENCDQGHSQAHRALPTDPDGECYGNFFRTGGDIRADFGVTMAHLQQTIPYQKDPPISRPGCWAHPDMLEVGNLKSATQDRTHFGAWCIVSAPLYLSLDLTDNAKMDSAWDVISNKEAIAVNQAWAGHPGRLVKDGGANQVWAKKLHGGAQAVLVLNRGTSVVPSFTLTLQDLGIQASSVVVRDIWAKKDLPSIKDVVQVGSIDAFDSVFLRLTPSGFSDITI